MAFCQIACKIESTNTKFPVLIIDAGRYIVIGHITTDSPHDGFCFLTFGNCYTQEHSLFKDILIPFLMVLILIIVKSNKIIIFTIKVQFLIFVDIWICDLFNVIVSPWMGSAPGELQHLQQRALAVQLCYFVQLQYFLQ